MATKYGMWEFLAPYSDAAPVQACIDWYNASNFDWLIFPCWGAGIGSVPTSLTKKLILRTYFHGEITGDWTAIRNSTDLYASVLANTLTQIGKLPNISAVTISEEEPNNGYAWPALPIGCSVAQITDYIAVYNQLRLDIQKVYPSLPVMANMHVSTQYNPNLTDALLDTLHVDGIVDDTYTADLTVMETWFRRMMRFGNQNAYCLIHAAAFDYWYDSITPNVVKATAALAETLGVPNVGFWAYDCSTSPGKSIIFNDWPVATDPNDIKSPGNYKIAIGDIVDAAVPVVTPVKQSSMAIVAGVVILGVIGAVIASKK